MMHRPETRLGGWLPWPAAGVGLVVCSGCEKRKTTRGNATGAVKLPPWRCVRALLSLAVVAAAAILPAVACTVDVRTTVGRACSVETAVHDPSASCPTRTALHCTSEQLV